MKEVGNLPSCRRLARTAQVIGVEVRIDHRGRSRPQLGEQCVIPLDVPARIDDDGIAVADEDVAERPLSNTVELYDMRERGCGRKPARDVDRLPRGHAAGDRVRLVPTLTQERGRLFAGITMAADDGDGTPRVELQIGSVGQRENLGIRQGVKLELGTERDPISRDSVGRAHVEHLQRLAAVQSLR